MAGRKSRASDSHSVIQSAFAAPLTVANIQSGLYVEDFGKRAEITVRLATRSLLVSSDTSSLDFHFRKAALISGVARVVAQVRINSPDRGGPDNCARSL